MLNQRLEDLCKSQGVADHAHWQVRQRHDQALPGTLDRWTYSSQCGADYVGKIDGLFAQAQLPLRGADDIGQLVERPGESGNLPREDVQALRLVLVGAARPQELSGIVHRPQRIPQLVNE